MTTKEHLNKLEVMLAELQIQEMRGRPLRVEDIMLFVLESCRLINTISPEAEWQFGISMPNYSVKGDSHGFTR